MEGRKLKNSFLEILQIVYRCHILYRIRDLSILFIQQRRDKRRYKTYYPSLRKLGLDKKNLAVISK